MTRCMTCRGLMVEVFEATPENPGCARFTGWRCLKCGATVKETDAPPPLNPSWLHGQVPDRSSQSPHMIYSLHDGLRRRMMGGGSPFGSSLQIDGAGDAHEADVRRRHWWA